MLQYVHGTTVLHRLPPLCKLGLAVLLSALCFATGNLLLLALLIGGSVALGALAGIGKQTLRTLLGLCALGGAPLFWVGMRVFHHKTRHRRFAVGVPAMAVFWIGLMAAWLAVG